MYLVLLMNWLAYLSLLFLRFLDLFSFLRSLIFYLYISIFSLSLSLSLFLFLFIFFFQIQISCIPWSLSIPEIPFVSEIPWLFSLISWSLLIPWSLLVSKIPLSQYLYFLSFVSFIPNLYIPLSLCHFTYQRLPILFLTVAALIWNRMPVVSLCAILISLFLDFYLLIPWSLPSLRYLYFLDL